MSTREIKNARIRDTMLGWEDHGIFTCVVTLDYGSSVQGFGTYGLDEWIAKEETRRGTAVGLQFIMEVLKVVGVSTWEELKGKYIRADADFGKVHRIGHITSDKWFDPAELFAKETPAVLRSL